MPRKRAAAKRRTTKLPEPVQFESGYGRDIGNPVAPEVTAPVEDESETVEVIGRSGAMIGGSMTINRGKRMTLPRAQAAGLVRDEIAAYAD